MYERKYFDIDEERAKTAHNMMSMSDYKYGSKTSEYIAYSNKAYDIAEKIAEKYPKQAERAWKMATVYSKKMADNINKDSRIGTMCPSILISGTSNFPVKKKEKQNAAMERNFEEFDKLQEYIYKLEQMLNGNEVIRSDDEDAISSLEEKLSKLEEEQRLMKELNAYYRRNKTLKGCTAVSSERAEKIENEMNAAWNNSDKPFPSYKLTNNNANIRRIKQRIADLKKERSKESSETVLEEIGVTIKENIDDMRIQIFFEEKPTAEVRKLLKSRAFKWSPNNSCWQRLITNDARYALKDIIAQLKTLM